MAQILERDGFRSASEKIRRGVSLIEAANEEFETALAGLGAPAEEVLSSASDATHGHAHEHSHEH